MSIRFLLGDSCISQLLSITHEICKSFDCNRLVDVRGTFSDISKAVDKVCQTQVVCCRKQTPEPNSKLSDKPSTDCPS